MGYASDFLAKIDELQTRLAALKGLVDNDEVVANGVAIQSNLATVLNQVLTLAQSIHKLEVWAVSEGYAPASE